MVAGKLDPTVGRICFLSYLSNGDESGEKDPGNEFRGSKKGGKEVWVGLKWPKNTKIRRPKLADSAAFAGPIRARPAAAGRKILLALSSSSSLSSACTVMVAGIGSHG